MALWFRRARSSAEKTPDVSAESADSRAKIVALAAEADRLRESADTASATARYEDVLRHDPRNTYALFWLATMAQERGDFAGARARCEQALAIEPDQIGLLLLLGSVAAAQADFLTAVSAYERVRALEASVPDIDALLADMYCFLGRLRDGALAFDRAVERRPNDARLASARLFVLNYADILSPKELFDEHCRWAQRFEQPLKARWKPFANSPEPERKLRIGYLSPDLRNHAVASFVEPLLREHDRDRCEITCFDISPLPEDDVSARLKSHAQRWRRVGGLDDDALAQAIRDDRIDILVDLAGHTRHNRMLALARKPAPVQAAWLGYLQTTGLDSMDYRITDAFMDPPGSSEALHTETLIRLPHQACFMPAAESPAPGPLPAQRRGSLTFGSVNQWSKVSQPVRQAWGRILAALPSARLIVIAQGAQNAAVSNTVRSELVQHGAAPGQIAVKPMLSLRDFLALFQELDVTLDPFPYGGGTTTMQSLWMGVPVVSLAGRTAMARNAVGPLHAVGLDRFCTGSIDEYVAVATGVAADLDALAAVRAGLRERMHRSPLLDAVAFARSIEHAHREMWRSYCISLAGR